MDYAGFTKKECLSLTSTGLILAQVRKAHFYSFNVSQNLSTHFTRSNYGYLNSIIIIIMVTATINANEREEIQTNILKCKNLEANRG